jgi:hypothetical protein
MQRAVRSGHGRALRAGWGRGHRARPAGTVVVLGRAGRDGEAALARVVAAYAEGTGGYSAQARARSLPLPYPYPTSPTGPWSTRMGFLWAPLKAVQLCVTARGTPALRTHLPACTCPPAPARTCPPAPACTHRPSACACCLRAQTAGERSCPGLPVDRAGAWCAGLLGVVARRRALWPPAPAAQRDAAAARLRRVAQQHGQHVIGRGAVAALQATYKLSCSAVQCMRLRDPCIGGDAECACCYTFFDSVWCLPNASEHTCL